MNTACFPLNYDFYGPTDRRVSDAARIFDLMSEDCSPSVINNKIESIQELYALLDECSGGNWDGYGSQPVNFESFAEAERFIHALPTTIIEPEIALDPDGEISVEWYIEPRRVFSVSIGERNELVYAGLFGPNKTYGREYFGDEIPKTILDNLDRLFS